MKYLGVGVGLRRKHFDDVLKDTKDVDWFELVSENFMEFGAKPRKVITELKKTKPLICHGLGLSLGSEKDISKDYLDALSELLEFTDSKWFSDHLCISSSLKHQYHDLLPILKTKESLANCVDKINFIQDYFAKPFAIENISYYGESSHNTISEIDFINELVEKTGCHILLDINNVYVNQTNLNDDALVFLSEIPHDKVIQIHLAGHDDSGDIVIDTHGGEICDPVWQLYKDYLMQAKRPISTLIEWDNNIPEYSVLNDQVLKAKAIMNEVFSNEA